jgi:hypothetical protein
MDCVVTKFAKVNTFSFLLSRKIYLICAVFRPQVTIATAMVFCHRFYLRQSLAKNDRRVSVILVFSGCQNFR